MTLYLTTKSHGEVESGFYSVFTQFVRLGENVFTTEDFCKMTKSLAENPKLKKIAIVSFTQDEFEENMGKVYSRMLNSISFSDMGNYLDKSQGRLPLVDSSDLHQKGRSVRVSVNKDFDSIYIGKYKIEAEHFDYMALYVAKGGVSGWSRKNTPNYAKPTLKAITTSENPLFEYIKSKK